MVQQNIIVLAVKSIVVDIIGDALYFPIWWYSVGLKTVLMNRVRSLDAMSEQLALKLLILNIFKPMFAQSDSAGRIISFFMRIVILIARSVFFAIFAVLQLCILILWVGVPLYVFYRIVGIYLSWYAAV
jgi:hypothetical protein